MNNLQMIYFVNGKNITPFLKEEDENNTIYYELLQIKSKKNRDNKSILELKTKRFLTFLKNGYTYQELEEQLNIAKEKIAERRNLFGLEEIYQEKEALKIAGNLYKKEKKLVKRP